MTDINKYTRKKEPELNRQLIIDAATDIAYETDWSHVTFQAIADRTGLSKGGIVHHFRNKEELLDQLHKESLSDLTQWIKEYKKKHDDNEGALGYLEFVLSETKNAKHKKIMRVIMKAILINPKYRDIWNEWHKTHIMRNKKEMSTKSLIVYLIADGIWYGENSDVHTYSKKDKERIIDYIKKL